MYFYTSSGDKKEQTSFQKFAAFYIEKFPLAFGGRAVYSNQKGVTSESTYMKIENATTVEYEFEDEKHAKSFESF